MTFQPVCLWSWAGRLAAGVTVATTLFAAPASGQHKHCRSHPRLSTDPECESVYSMLARESLQNPLRLQAQRGREIEDTLWNFHFEPDANGAPTDKLRPSGRALLHRIARRQSPNEGLRVFLQTANDVPIRDDELEQSAQQQLDLNQRRAKKVHDYVTIVLRRQPPELYVHDRNREYMWGYEAVGIYKMLKSSGKGVLNPQSVEGITYGPAYGQGMGGGGGGEMGAPIGEVVGDGAGDTFAPEPAATEEVAPESAPVTDEAPPGNN